MHDQPPVSPQKNRDRAASLARIVNNTGISLLGQVVTWSSTLLLTIAYGRFLGDVKLGELYFALTFVSLIGFPIEFGFNQQLTRDVAQKPEQALRYFSSILLIKVFLWLILYIIMLITCRLLNYSVEIYILVVICGITVLSNAIVTTCASSHFVFERVVFPVIGNILEKGLGALFGFLLLKGGASVQIIALVLLGGSLINLLWQASNFFRLIGFSFTIDLALVRTLLYSSIPFIIYGVLSVIYYRVDTILLSFFTNTAVVGWYGAGYRIFDTCCFLPSLVINAIMSPVFSKLSVTSTSGLKEAIEKTSNFLLLVSLPLATLMIVEATPIVSLLYHRPEFMHTVPVLQALAPGLIFLYINSVLGCTLVNIKKEKKITLMAAIALVFNLGLNLILLPQYQQVGAAVMTSCTELLLLFLSLYFVPKNLLPVGSLRVGAKMLLACLVMALVVWMLRAVTIFLVLPLAMLVYLVAILLLNAIPKEDLQLLYRAVKSKTNNKEIISTESEEILISLQTTLPMVAIQNPQLHQWEQRIDLQVTEKWPSVGVRRSTAKIPLSPSQQQVNVKANKQKSTMKKIKLMKVVKNDQCAAGQLADLQGTAMDQKEELVNRSCRESNASSQSEVV
ncbi:MAG: flippase [Chloroflexi bacterium]|nr:MAG: flippase [Chloroflexota bacterium]